MNWTLTRKSCLRCGTGMSGFDERRSPVRAINFPLW